MQKILFKNCNILNGTENMEIQENIDILVCGEKIEKIGKDLSSKLNESDKADKNLIVKEMKGTYVIPGLINLHVHLPAGGKPSKKKVANKKKLANFISTTKIGEKIGIFLCNSYAKQELYSGTTTIRAVGGIGNIDSKLRNLINSGKKTGPRILACDEAIGVPNGHMDGTVARAFATPEEAAKRVEELKNNKVDWIKLMITGGILDAKEVGHPGVLKMQADMVKSVCDKAHSLNIKVCAHVEGPEGLKIAIENGVDTIEHGSKTDYEMIDMLKKRNGAQVITLSPAVPLAILEPDVTGYDDACKINSNVLMEFMVDMAKKCMEKGVTLGMGTDTGCPMITHYDMYRELIYFTKYLEVSPKYALYTATMVNAEILGLENEIGSIEEGKLADMVFTSENPLENLKTISNPSLVVKSGKMYSKKVKKYPQVEEILNDLENKLRK